MQKTIMHSVITCDYMII